MADRYTFGDVSGSIVAAGKGAQASGIVGPQASRDVAELQRRLASLRDELGQLPRTSATGTAGKEVTQLAEAIDEGAGKDEVHRKWRKVGLAVSGLAITANISQIGSLIEALWT